MVMKECKRCGGVYINATRTSKVCPTCILKAASKRLSAYKNSVKNYKKTHRIAMVNSDGVFVGFYSADTVTELREKVFHSKFKSHGEVFQNELG